MYLVEEQNAKQKSHKSRKITKSEEQGKRRELEGERDQ